MEDKVLEVPRGKRDNGAALEKARAVRAAKLAAKRELEKTGGDMTQAKDAGYNIGDALYQSATKSLWSSAYVAALQSCAVNHPSKSGAAIALADQAVKDFEARFPK